MLVSAASTPQLSSSAIGVAVGAGIGMGASVAMSNATVQVTADVGNNATISGGALTISALAAVPASGNTTYASSIAAGGGLLYGLQATYSQASEDATVNAYGGTGLTLPSANVTIAAENDSSQDATATGVAVGYIGAGATVTQTSSDAHTAAYLGAGAITVASNLGVLSITATGNDSNTASSTAGSGGVIAGAAAVATTSTTSTTTATLYGNGTTDTLYFGGLGINATHTTNYSDNGDAYQASAVGASGGNGTNTVVSNVTAEVGTNLIVNSAAGDMNVIASDYVIETSGGARAGSGGIAAGAATLSDSTVTQNVTVNIDGGTIFSLNDDPSSSTAKINIEAYNSLETVDTVSLTAAGLFAGGGAQSDLTATANVAINISASELFSAGDLDIGTASQMLAANDANANLYGLVSGAGASTNTSLTANQNVSIGASTLEAWGLINIYAGQSGDGDNANGINTSTLTADATTTVYNYALIPISAKYKGSATADDYTTLTLATGSQVLGVNNVFIGATQGSVTANGKGTNYNPYLSLFSTENHDDNSSTDGSDNVVLNGVVAAGIHNQELVTIALNGTVTLASGGSPYGLALELVNSPSDFSPIVSYNHQKVQYANIGSFNPYQEILTEISQLSGLTTAQVDAQLQSGSPTITAINDDAAGDVQRQINTLIQQAPFAANASGSAYAFGDILVSAGNVSILAQTLSGAIVNHVTPSVTARDSAKIDFENQGLQFLDLSNLTVTGVSGGHITFTGSASSSSVTQSSTQGITFSEDLSGLIPSIIVNASYNRVNNAGQGIDQNGNLLQTTPDIYFNGAVENINGLLNITNQLGNVVATQTFDAATIQMLVPNGSFTFNGGAGSIYSTNNAVASQWSHTEYRPTDLTTAVDAVATWLGTYGDLMENGGNAYTQYWDCCSNSGGNLVNATVTNYGSNASTVFTARLLNEYYDGGGQVVSAIFLPMGYVNNDTSANTVGNEPWERGNYEGQAYSAHDSGPFNCSGCGVFFTTINIQNQAINGVTATAAVNPPASVPVIEGKAIILSASVLNINGTIQSGHSSNFSVNIGANAQNVINFVLDNAPVLAAAKRNAASGNYLDLSPYITTVGAGDTQIDAKYDALTNQILLNNVVQGSGGYVYLNGKIISTSTSGSAQGSIIVNGGAGTVTVNNSTGVELVTNTINTGVSAASVVEIVDQNKNLTTWYVYNAGASANQQVSVYTEAGVSNTSYKSANLQNTGANSGLSYAPMANQLYQWVDTTTLTRSVGDNPAAFGWNFSGVSANAPTYPYSETTSLTTGSQSTNYQETVSATGSYTQYDVGTGSHKCCGSDFNGDWYQRIYNDLTLTLTNSVKASYPISISFNGGGTSTVSVTSNASVLVNGSINNLQGATSINATGAGSAILNGANPLVSGTSVTLNAPGGIAAIGAPLPVQVYGGTVSATSVDNDIAIAATGSLSIIQVKANPATLGNAPQGNIFISATGDITSASAYNVGTPIVVGKSIEIDSSGGAVGAVSSTDSHGSPILTNINPLVIEATPTLLANGTLDGGLLNSSSSTGAYIVQSTGDLRLGAITSSGPVFLAAAASDGQTANILNGQAIGGLTAAQTAYLKNVWNSLDLLSGSGAAAVSAYESVINGAYNDYWQLRNLAFGDGQDYSITAQGTAVIAAQLAAETGADPSTISPAQIQAEATTRFQKDEYLLGLQTPAQLGVSLDTLFGTAAGQTSQFQPAVSTPALTTALGTYSSSFSYQLPTGPLYTSLTSGSQWSLDQLTYTVSASANPANAAPPPSIQGLPLNISARQVMLYAPTGAIGSLAAPQTFSFTSVDDSSLTSADKALLASAGPGQLSVTTTTVNNIQEYTVSVAQASLIIVSPLGPVSAKAQSQIYLGSATDMLLGGIANSTFGPITAAISAGVQTTSGGNIRLDAVGSILGGVANQVAISGNVADLTLIAETGSIGQAPAAGTNPATNPNALLLALSGSPVGQLDQAVSAQGIYLNQTTGDLILGNINGGSGSAGIVQLAAYGSIYAEPQFTDRSSVHIIGSALDLRAGGSVSFNGATFQPLQVQISGAVTGSAGGAMTILSPASDLTVGQAGTYGVLTSGGALTLDTPPGALTINADVTSTGALQLLANGAATFAAGTSGAPIVASSTSGSVTLAAGTLSMGAYSGIDAAGTISITTTGDATLGQLDSSDAPATVHTTVISVAAGGVSSAGGILSNGDGRINILASAPNAAVSLQAGGGIGSTSLLTTGTTATALGVETPWLAVNADQMTTGPNTYALGNVSLTLTGATHIPTLAVPGGSATVLGNLAITIDSLTAATTVGVTSTGGALTLGTSTSAGTQTIEGKGNVSFTTLTTTGTGDVDVTSDTGSIMGGTILAAGSSTLKATASGQSISGAAVTATNGLISMQAGGAITWTGALAAGTTVGVTSTGGVVTLNSVMSPGTQTIEGNRQVSFTSLTTTGTGDVDVTSDTGSIIGGTVDAAGSSTLKALTAGQSIGGTAVIATAGLISMKAGGAITWTGALAAGTTVGLTSTGGAITLDIVNSGGTQTIEANNNVGFTKLKTTGILGDAGDIDVTADTGSIIGGTIFAAGGSTLKAVTAGQSITGAAVNATTGLISMQAGGAITWTGALQAGTTVGVTSSGGTITLDTVTSGGTQTIEAKNDVDFTTLKTTGILGDAGDIDVTADTGSVSGGTILAAGGSTLKATASGQSISGTAVTATNGLIGMQAGGAISWTGALAAHTTVGLTSSGGTITLSTVTSAGTQTIEGNGDVTFTTLTTTGTGDVDVTADTGSVIGGTILAAGGSTLKATANGQSITGAAVTATAGLISMQAGGAITWTGALQAGTTVGLTSTGGTITVNTITSGGTQTIEAKNDVDFTTLKATGILGDAGDIDLTADTGSVVGGTILAAGGSTLKATASGQSITGAAVNATTGLISMQAGGAITWTGALAAGTTVGLTSTGSTITLNTITSGGTQTIEAKNDVDFTTLKATGILADPGDIDVTADTGSVIGGTILAAGGSTLRATANGQSITGAAVTATNGLISMQAGGAITWTGALEAGTTVGLTSSGGTITLNTVTSAGTQTFEGNGEVTFTTLTTTATGDVDVTSDTGSVIGGTILAAGGSTLRATASGQSITGAAVTATAGLISMKAGGAITWTGALQAGTTAGVTSTGGTITVNTITSGGTQTIEAKNDVDFTTLKAIGIQGGDAGNIDLTADTGAIAGRTTGPNPDGSINAHGSSTLSAVSGSITGNAVTASTGSLGMKAGGAITWTGALQAGTTVGLTSTGGTITLNTVTSGGTQTIEAKTDVDFTTLTATGIQGDAGDIDVTADAGSVTGGTILAAGGSTLRATASGQSITGAAVTATNGLISMRAGGAITWTGALQAGTTVGVTSTGGTITVNTITSGGTQTLEAKNDVDFTTLTATGIPGDAGNIDLTADTGSIMGTTITVAAQATLTAFQIINGQSLTTGTFAKLTAGGAINWASIEAGTTVMATSTGGTITLGTVTSGGSQTIEAKNDVDFTTLTATGIPGDAGNIDVTADTGSITGTTVTAAAQATLTAFKVINGQSLTTGTFAKLTAGSALNWTSIAAGTTVTATSTGGTITLGSVTSGGSQTIEAKTDVDFTTLTATGIPGDAGNIDVTADTGSIMGTTVTAAAQATLTAFQIINGQSLTTGTFAKLTAGGTLDWSSIQAGTTVQAHSTGGSATFGTVVSGGTQTLRAANDLVFTQLTTTGIAGDAGDVNLTSDQGAVRGGSISANGSVNETGNGLFFDAIGAGANVTLISLGSIQGQLVNAAGSLLVTATGPGASVQIANMSASQTTLQSQGLLSFANMNVGSSANLGADQIVGNITHAGTTPLALNITGWQGGVATLVMLNIDPLAALNFGTLWAVDATVVTDAPIVTIANGFVPGSMTLTMAEKTLFLNDRTSLPTSGSNVQMFTLQDAFTLVQDGTATWTNAYVVQFQPGSSITAYLGPDVLLGTSLVDDLPRAARDGDPDLLTADAQSTAQTSQTDADGFEHPHRRPAVEKLGNGPAVNLGPAPLKKKRAQR